MFISQLEDSLWVFFVEHGWEGWIGCAALSRLLLLLPDDSTCPAVRFPVLSVQCSFAGGFFPLGLTSEVPRYRIFPCVCLSCPAF